MTFSARHGKQTIANGGIHSAISYIYADAAERLAATGFDENDLYKLSYQSDNGTVWVLTNTAGPTWSAFGSGASGSASGDLSGTYPNPQVVDLTISGQSQGSILYYNGANWVVLNPGTDGYVLTTHSTGANPSWTPATTGALASTPPVDVTKAAAQTGTSLFAARADHKHDISVGTPVSIGPTNSAGSSSSLARADHTHAVVDLDISGQSQGALLYFNGVNWVVLASGQDGYVLTAHGALTDPTWEASVAGNAGPSAIAAGTQIGNSGTISFVNSNGMTFGMSNSNHITASYTVPSIAGLLSAVNFSAGTTSNNLSAITFGNANGLAFGLNNSTITGSYTVPSTAGLLSAINVSGGTTSNNLSAIVFSNSNNVSFGLNGSTLTGSIPLQTNQTEGFYAVGNTVGQSSSSTFDARTLSISGAGVASVGYSAGNLIISVPSGIANINVSAGTTSNNLTNFVFSNSNNVSFGLNGSTITGSIPVQTNQTGGFYAVGNTTGQSSSSTIDARSISFDGAGAISVGYSGGSVVISAATQTSLSFSNANGVSFGIAGSTLTASVPSTAGLISAINVSAGTTSNNLTAITFSNANGLTFGLNGSTITGSYTVPTQTNQTVGLYALGNTTQNSSTTLDARSLSFNGIGAVTIGYSNGSIQVSVPVQSVQTQSLIAAIYDGANSISTGTIRFSNANGVTFGINGQTLTGSVTPQSVQSIGIYHVGNTTGQSSSSTFDARSLSFQGGGIVSVGNSNGSIIISAVAAGAGDGGNILIAGTQTAISNASVIFSNSNGISFGMSNSSVITASYTVPSTVGLISAINLSAGTTSNNLTNFVFSNSNNVSFGLNGSTITGSIPVQTNQTLGLYAIGNTTGQSSSSTFDARTLSVSGVGGASVGYSGNNLIISAPLVKKVSQLIWPENPWQTNFGISNASFSLQHFNAKENITATQANLLMALAGNTNSSGALTISLGIYTMAGSTMSLASSDSRQITWTSGGATDSSSVFGGVSGTRYRTVGLGTWAISAGDYMIGMWFRTTNNGTWHAFGQQGPTIVGAQDVNETQAYLHGFSTSSYSTAMVASINVTDTNYVRTGGDALQQPGIVFLGTY